MLGARSIPKRPGGLMISLTDLRTAYQGWTRVLIATFRLPDGQSMRREIEDHGNAVAVLPYDAERRTAILISQFRAPVFHASKAAADALYEAIAGLVESDDPAGCGRREAFEETGLALSALEPAGTVWTMPGLSTERMHLFLAPYAPAARVGAGGGVADEHERISVHELPLGEIAAMADAGKIEDMKTLLLVQTLRLRRPDLFA
jgi:nudix-type nucleoside diphosphatase (YffH/AdpP family)